MEKYCKYTVEDFVVDDDFRSWALSPEESGNVEWNKFVTDFPSKKDDIEEAILILKSIESIEDNEVSTEKLNLIWENILTDKNNVRPLVFRNLLKYAAIFIFAFILGFGVFKTYQGNNQYSSIYNEIKVPYGERSEITLYDGTKVWLNSGTSLKFPLVFNEHKRNVIVDGEAFFDVAKNEKQPFIVDAGSMEIEVVGTRFNICAYADDQEHYATLEKGKIIAKNILSGEKIEMYPGDNATLNLKTKSIKKQSVNTDLYTSWKDNLLRFEDAEFAEVVKKMERWYDVKIILDETIDTNRPYTMTIKTESLREMLNLLSYTAPIKYEIKENKVFINKR